MPRKSLLSLVVAVVVAMLVPTVAPTGSFASPAKAAAASVKKSKTSKKRRAYRNDRKAPKTTIRGKSSRKGRVTVRFKADEPSTYKCRVNRSRWKTCKSPAAYVPSTGSTLQVRATDRAGNVERRPATTTLAPTSTYRPDGDSESPTSTETDSAPAVTPVHDTDAAKVPTSGTTKGTTTQAPGFEPLSDQAAAARVVRSPYEPRPENTAANNRVPTAAELADYQRRRAGDHFCASKLDLKVTGNFSGTTDEILQWAAAKWGFDANLFRAIATAESFWRQSAGDDVDGGGLTSVRWVVHKGTYPLGRVSSAFNVDYFGAILRHYYDGCATWLNDVERGQNYAAGDLWGSVGVWYAGRWRTKDAEWYIGNIRNRLGEQIWATDHFLRG